MMTVAQTQPYMWKKNNNNELQEAENFHPEELILISQHTMKG